MNRRQFLRASALSASALALNPRRALASDIPKSALRTPHSRKPNLVFLMTDQQRWDTLACYGNRVIHAPTLNKLASESVIYDNAIVSHPVCTPSRGCMMTGLWPHQSGVTANNIRLPRSTPCYPELINDPDYRTAQIGKWHLGDELFAQHGFQEWVGTEDQYQAHFYPDRDKDTKSDYWHFLSEKGLKPGKNGYFSREFACRQPIENGKPAFQAMKAVEFLRRNKNNPFILQVSYLEPHTPFISPLKNRYDDEPLPPPESYFKRHENPDSRSWRVRMLQDYFAKRKTFSGPPAQLSEINRHYYGNVSVVDRSVATILAELERLGLADNTIIVFTSDHGELLGAHGLWFKEIMYQEAMRVPMFIKVPGARGGTRITAPWQHTDLVPTLLGLMGKPVPANLPGRNRAPEIHGEHMPAQTIYSEWTPNVGTDDESPGRSSVEIAARKKKAEAEAREKAAGNPAAPAQPAVLEHQKYMDSSSRVAISPDNWKLWLSDADIPQLFNMNEDPLELRNLYKESQHRDRVKTMTADILKWQENTNDRLTLARS